MDHALAAAYNRAADTYRSRYDSFPPRVENIEQVLDYLEKDNPHIIEIGCAYGRDAQYMVTKTNQYHGFDISERYIEMARAEVPTGSFSVSDVMDFDWPPNVDAVIAFASLLHSSKEELQTILDRIEQVLNPGGVIFLSLKRRDVYESVVENDGLVSRRFYYYTREVIQEIIPAGMVEVFYEEQSRSEEWFNMILQKQ